MNVEFKTRRDAFLWLVKVVNESYEIPCEDVNQIKNHKGVAYLYSIESFLSSSSEIERLIESAPSALREDLYENCIKLISSTLMMADIMGPLMPEGIKAALQARAATSLKPNRWKKSPQEEDAINAAIDAWPNNSWTEACASSNDLRSRGIKSGTSINALRKRCERRRGLTPSGGRTIPS